MASARQHTRGFTLVELLMGSTLLLAMALVLGASLDAARSADRYLESTRCAATHAQATIFEVANLVASGRHIFEADDAGNAYLAAMDFSWRSPIPEARLPLIDATHALGPDDGSQPWTGNMLLFVRESDSLPCVTVAGEKRMAELESYRFVCVYPALETVSGGAAGPVLELVVWRSVAFAAYPQLLDLPAGAERESAVRDLVVRYGIEAVWSPDEPCETAFRRLSADGTVSEPIPAFTVEEDPDLSPRGRLVSRGLHLARTDPGVAIRRAVLARPVLDAGGLSYPWDPDGFEVKITGGSQARQVWLHLVLENPISGSSETVLQDATVIVYARDV